MYISRSVLLLIITAYVFSPTAFSWMIDPGGAWYRPYLLWGAIVLTTLFMQLRQAGTENDEPGAGA